MESLQHLDAQFLDYLSAYDSALQHRLLDYRQAATPLTPLETSELLLAVAYPRRLQAD